MAQPLFPSGQNTSQDPERLMLRLPWAGSAALLRLLGGDGPAAHLVQSVPEPQVRAGVPLPCLIVTWLPGPEPSLAADPVWLSPPLACWCSGNSQALTYLPLSLPARTVPSALLVPCSLIPPLPPSPLPGPNPPSSILPQRELSPSSMPSWAPLQPRQGVLFSTCVCVCCCSGPASPGLAQLGPLC